MNTTELIELLKRNEHGGITGKPRVISLYVDGTFIAEPDISLESTGDGIAGAEISLGIRSKEETTEDRLNPCPFCGYEWPEITYDSYSDSFDFACPNCGAERKYPLRKQRKSKNGSNRGME